MQSFSQDAGIVRGGGAPGWGGGGGVELRGVGAHGVLGLMGCWDSWGVGIWSGGGALGCWGSGVLGLMGCWNMEWRWGSGVID